MKSKDIEGDASPKNPLHRIPKALKRLYYWANHLPSRSEVASQVSKDAARQWEGRVERLREAIETCEITFVEGVRPSRHWSHKELNLLGRKPDSLVAKIIGISHTMVLKKRQSLGIAPCGHQCSPPGKVPQRWTADELGLLGTLPDRAIAAKLGKSATTVWRKRQERKIPPYTQSQ